MSLGRREARHQTVAAARTAGVSPEDYWDFKPGQKVMTADGFAGVVAAVEDGPFANPTYDVRLDNGMGGGQYTASMLKAMPQAEASVEQKTAADDYPELGTILIDRPPLALSTKGGLQTQAWDREEWDERNDEHERDDNPCSNCGGSGELQDGSECSNCDASGQEPVHKGASLQVEADLDDQIKVPEPGHNQTFPISTHKPSAAEYIKGFTEGHGSGVSGPKRADLEHRGPYDAYEHGLVHGHNAANGAQGLYQHLQSATDVLGMSDGGNLSKWLTENNHSHGRTASLQAEAGNDGEKYGTCANCGDTNVRVTTQGTDTGSKWVGLGGACSCSKKESAYDHGDPNEYTSGHKCPNCGSDRSLESAVGVIKCEDCGYAEQNGQKDGWGGAKTAGAAYDYFATPQKSHNPSETKYFPTDPASNADSKYHQDIGASCARCGFSARNAKPGDSCLLCGSQMSNHPDKIVHALLDDPYRLLVVAAADSDFRFHVTASFADVRNKAKRLRSEGKVSIIAVTGGTVVANVKGDTAVYETEIVRLGSNAIAQWHCGCKWGAYAWGRQPAFKRFEGRLCSHALALHFEAQSQGMFGRQVSEEEKSPQWLKARTRVVTDFDRDDRRNVSRPAQPRKRDLARTYSAYSQVDVSPLETLVTTALAEGAPIDEVVLACRTAGLDATAYIVEAGPDGYQKTEPKSHHKDRSGDLAPCARGGCGHPEGIHGEEGGHCTSAGCECPHYQGVGKTARRHHKKRKSHRHTVRMHYGAPWHGIGWGLGGWGGYGGYYGPGEGGGGSGGDGGGGDGGGGSEGAVGDIRPVLAAAFPVTMEPTYTPGNDPRHWEQSQGPWNATMPAQPWQNPGSTGFASTGDPKEFNVSTDIVRDSSLHAWPSLDVEAKGKVDGWGPIDMINRVNNGFDKVDRAVLKPVMLTDDLADLALKGIDKVVPGNRSVAPKAAPKIAPTDIIPIPGPAKGVGKGLKNLIPGKAPAKVPSVPGKGTPAKPDGPDAPEPQAQKQPAGTKPGQPNSRTKADDAPKGSGAKGKGDGKAKSSPRVAPRVAPKWIIPNFGQMPKPDYYRASDALISGHGIGSRASLADEVAEMLAEAALTPQQEFANGVAETYNSLGGNPPLSTYKEAADYNPGVEAELHEEPEPALPSTDGEALEAQASLDGEESVDDIVAAFQATAGAVALASGSSAGGDAGEGGDVAAAAKAFLAKEAMKTFSPAEQKQIIDEGMDVTASNLDRLDIKGTHYEPLEAALASADLTEDDDLDL